jgi:hypothetical protein
VHTFRGASEVQFFRENAKGLKLPNFHGASPFEMEPIITIYWTDG